MEDLVNINIAHARLDIEEIFGFHMSKVNSCQKIRILINATGYITSCREEIDSKIVTGLNGIFVDTEYFGGKFGIGFAIENGNISICEDAGNNSILVDENIFLKSDSQLIRDVGQLENDLIRVIGII